MAPQMRLPGLAWNIMYIKADVMTYMVWEQNLKSL